MAIITEYQIEDRENWDRIVHSFPNYDIFYLSGYAKAFMQESPQYGEPVLILYTHESDRAMNVVFKRDISLDQHFQGKIRPGERFDLITPYGYGGFLGSITDWAKFNETYTDYCSSRNYVCEFVRFSLFTDYHQHYAGEIETRTHNVVRSLTLPLEEMWMDFKQKVRKNVKKAQSYQLQILMESTTGHLDDFLRIYYATMTRTDAEKSFFFSDSFFRTLGSMRDNIMFFYTLYDGRIISAELVLYGTENCYSFLGGTDNEYFQLRPNDFLKYEVIKWAKEKGLKNFILGGGYGSDDGIFQYKQALAPHGVVDFYIGRMIFRQEDYDQLVKMRTEPLNQAFFPLYRS